MPRRDRSKPMRPRWMANSVTMKDQIQARSIGARASSSTAIRSASCASTGSSGRRSLANAVSPLSEAENTGDETIFHAVPAIRSPLATASVQLRVYSRRATRRPATARLPSIGRIQAAAVPS